MDVKNISFCLFFFKKKVAPSSSSLILDLGCLVRFSSVLTWSPRHCYADQIWYPGSSVTSVITLKLSLDDAKHLRNYTRDWLVLKTTNTSAPAAGLCAQVPWLHAVDTKLWVCQLHKDDNQVTVSFLFWGGPVNCPVWASLHLLHLLTGESPDIVFCCCGPSASNFDMLWVWVAFLPSAAIKSGYLRYCSLAVSSNPYSSDLSRQRGAFVCRTATHRTPFVFSSTVSKLTVNTARLTGSEIVRQRKPQPDVRRATLKF